MTEEQFSEIKARCEAATDGPWVWLDTGGSAWAKKLVHVFHPYAGRPLTEFNEVLTTELTGNTDAIKKVEAYIVGGYWDVDIDSAKDDFDFIAHSRSDIELLIAEVYRLRNQPAAVAAS